MRFMIIVKANKDSEAGVMPSSEAIAKMGVFNEKMIEAGVMLAGDGLHPSSKGARIKSENGKIVVTDGPFSETKELIAGFWMIQTKSYEEALEWCKRIPFDPGMEVELRKAFEASDFVSDSITEEHLAKEQEFRDAQKPISNG
ncbi:YciI family protein [Devosia algicola]|uniref:YciI family protein n=1 Tax=Devosia algicola TaxID=3026418 RepID=A0ABY7YKT8_9HYPH|nr:YciI family protein [Devosia algicola]WDR01689.1 YciI family protein [Devosia algicola]